jgi:hypothetical protein
MPTLPFLHRRSDTEEAINAAVAEAECPHGVRLPHWDNNADLGHMDRVSYFVCESCGEVLSPQQDAVIDPAAPAKAADFDEHVEGS